MSKTPIEVHRERYNEIRKEILQISESYTLVRQNRQNNFFLEKILENQTGEKSSRTEEPRYEQRHMQLLHNRLNDLIKELNVMSAKGEIQIPILWKDAVNQLRRSLLDNCPKEFVKVANDIEHLNEYLI